MGVLDDIYEIPGLRKIQTTLNQLVKYVPPPPPPDKGTPRKILMVTSHPVPESFSMAIARTVYDTAREQGHEIQCIDLGLDGYDPSLTAKERRSYFKEYPTSLFWLPGDVKRGIKKLQWCDTLVLVYPTWWMNTPANLKGFFDRTLLMHHTWGFPKPPETEKKTEEESPEFSFEKLSAQVSTQVSALFPQPLQPGLPNIQRVVGISTYGASRSALLLGGDNGRNMISTAIRPIFSPDCTVRWHGLYDMDFQTDDSRASFLEEIKATIQENL
jgi:putative NADPH-quinone reductase